MARSEKKGNFWHAASKEFATPGNNFVYCTNRTVLVQYYRTL